MSQALELHDAFVRGDVAAIRSLLGDPPGFPNSETPDWLGDVLTYAVYWSPLAAIEELLELGADARRDPGDGFPPLIAATDRRPRDGRDERVEVMRLLLAHGADPNVQGMNDGTPLHQVVWKRDGWADHLEAARVLLEGGADPHVKTRIDDFSSALEDAQAADATALVQLLGSWATS